MVTVERARPWGQRLLGAAVLVPAGVFSLPLAAYLLDRGPGTENVILPSQLLVMMLLGAALAGALPALAPRSAGIGRRLLTGAGWGLLAAVLGVAVFWLLLNGLTGA